MFHGLVPLEVLWRRRTTVLATISDPYGKVERKVKAPNSGYIINVNDAPMVYQGDAIYHISIHIAGEETPTAEKVVEGKQSEIKKKTFMLKKRNQSQV